MLNLDCTLRDGGYYTNWDFTPELVDIYIKAMTNSDVDYIEIGYRSPKLETYKGEYYYSPLDSIKKISSKTDKKLCLMLDLKNFSLEDIEIILKPCSEYIHMIRFAINPDNYFEYTEHIKKVKMLGFEIAVNFMYFSEWVNDSLFINEIVNWGQKLNVDFLYFVDSHGAVFPGDIDKLFSTYRKPKNLRLGFHAHDNLSLAFANTLTAIKHGVDIVDSTLLGMGRGAGNLKTELILQYKKHALNSHLNNHSSFHTAYSKFKDLNNLHGWGTNLSYITSGLISYPQGKVMDLIQLRSCDIKNVEDIILDRSSKKEKIVANENFKIKKEEKILLIGGGTSVLINIHYIRKLLSQDPKIILVFTSSKYLKLFKEYYNKSFLVLVGDEIKRLENLEKIDGLKYCYFEEDETVLLPQNRKNCYRIHDSFFKNKIYSRTETSFAIAQMFECEQCFVVGFDGYSNPSKKEGILMIENQSIFNTYSQLFRVYSLLPSNYVLQIDSLFSKFNI